ncbi:LOW QUALITY PROTEIN: secreted protein, partial [Streptomyces pristinaespiralis ATCC 25486]
MTHGRLGSTRRRPRRRAHSRLHRGAGGTDSAPGACPQRRTTRPLPPHPPARPQRGHPLHRPCPSGDRPARTGRVLPAAAGHHRGQPRGRDRHRPLLPGHRSPGGLLRDRELPPSGRAAHGHHLAQRRGFHGPGEDTDLPRHHQQPAPRRAGRRHRQVGAEGQPGGDQGHRSPAVHQGRDAEADAGRAGQACRDPRGRRATPVADPDGGGRQAVRRAARGGQPHCRDPQGRGPGPGHRRGVPGGAPQRPRSEVARLPVPPDAAPARPGAGQHLLGDPRRGHRRTGGGVPRLRRSAAAVAGHPGDLLGRQVRPGRRRCGAGGGSRRGGSRRRRQG